MKNISTILFTLFLFLNSFAQNERLRDDVDFTVCEGAINIFENGEYRLQFTGKTTKNQNLARYKSVNFAESNQIWVAYKATQAGSLTFQASSRESYLQMAVFKNERSSICSELNRGVAEIVRIHKKTEDKLVGLGNEVSGGVLYKLDLQEGEEVVVLFSTTENLKARMLLQWEFNELIEEAPEEKIVDKRYDDFGTTLAIKVFEKETLTPLIVNIALEGQKEIAGIYIGSEFLFNNDHTCDLTVKCNAQGYFFHDSTYRIKAFEDNEISIYLEKIASGKKMLIANIEFVPGTSEITKASYPNLRRLQEFLALNADINIEIQGHVFALGDNSYAAQRISEARARRVMKYLIDNGIDRSRLTAIGFGNTKPIYEKPEHYYEEQANRRVEVEVQ